MKNTIPSRSFLSLLVGIAMGTASATVIVNEDFEGIANVTDGAFTRADVESSGVRVTLKDDGDPFGLGSDNQYVHHQDNRTDDGAVAGIVNGIGSVDGSVFSVNFLFYEPDLAGFNDGISIRIADTTYSDTAAVNFSLDDGAVGGQTGAYSLNTVYGLDIIANESGATVNYAGGNSVAHNRYDVWITTTAGASSLVLDDQAFSNTGQNLQSLFFMTFSSAKQQLYYDNVTITDDEALVLGVSSIPEPSSLMLVFGGLAAGALLFRRRS